MLRKAQMLSLIALAAWLFGSTGLAQTPDIGSHLAHELAIDAGHGDMRLLLDRDIDAVRNVEHDRVRVTEREDHLLALDLGAVTHADDVELLLETVGDTRNRVGDQAARQTMELAQLRIVGRELRVQFTVGHLEPDAVRHCLPQLALRSLDFDRAVEHLDGDALGNRDRLFSDSRHLF